ncbi:MAG TPA: hypothetical protein EYP98_10700, partial [Planctomycetes bacterium]|nr:hypothetical protein [Planctomycetota bacterium]
MQPTAFDLESQRFYKELSPTTGLVAGKHTDMLNYGTVRTNNHGVDGLTCDGASGMEYNDEQCAVTAEVTDGAVISHLHVIDDVSATETIMSMRTSSGGNRLWLVDSGANAALCTSEEYFDDLQAGNTRVSGVGGNMRTDGRGEVTIQLCDDLNIPTERICVRNVLYAKSERPDQTNILSLSQLKRGGMRFDFDKMFIYCGDSKTQKTPMYEINGLYYVQALDPNAGGYVSDKDTSVRVSTFDKGLRHIDGETAEQFNQRARKRATDLQKWRANHSHITEQLAHQRLCHPGKQRLTQVLQGAGMGISVKERTNQLDCDGCARAKLRRQPVLRREAKPRSMLTGSMISLDFWGAPAGMRKVKRHGDIGGVIFIIDEATRMMEAYAVGTGTSEEHLIALKHFITKHVPVHKVSGRRQVDVVQSDSTSSCAHGVFNDWCADHDIKQQYANPGTQAQNGVIERHIQTAVDQAVSIMQHARAPMSLWVDAIKTAVYTKNRLPCTILDGASPYEARYGQPPDLTRMRVPFCDMYVKNKADGKVGHMARKSDRGIFVGYHPNTKQGHMVLMPNGYIKTAWHTTAHEQSFRALAQYKRRNTEVAFTDSDSDSEGESVAAPAAEAPAPEQTPARPQRGGRAVPRSPATPAVRQKTASPAPLNPARQHGTRHRGQHQSGMYRDMHRGTRTVH